MIRHRTSCNQNVAGGAVYSHPASAVKVIKVTRVKCGFYSVVDKKDLTGNGEDFYAKIKIRQ
ncbi:hypothetical protein [Microbulbifer sp. 2205BS26-8]|uniref:hypothetical protein n=1 Tax=Microbulbifer sp. 2205BS26-8 TaxID=3064386 RepID=UPI00273DCAB0|nr:hypothetical protein [Microbulbifer sp. 2205BS26-8]MDP5210749.1 hypothetical protein [Microbulbifer sp. 2205BS26-8]